jgi:hypothetical protein
MIQFGIATVPPQSVMGEALTRRARQRSGQVAAIRRAIRRVLGEPGQGYGLGEPGGQIASFAVARRPFPVPRVGLMEFC